MSVKCRLLTPKHTYKPMNYPWALEAWRTQQKMHWISEEVPLAEDVRDWNSKLSETERNLLTQIFRFFTQADIEVGNCYNQHYLRVFGPIEIKMMLTAFSNMETIHVEAYSYLLDTIGMPEVEYSAFMKYKEMKDKFDYLQGASMKNPRDIAKTLAIFGAFTEGLSLFSSFAMLMNFPRFNKMKGMGQIVTLSVKDEMLHCANIIRLFREFVKENINIWDDELKQSIYEACRVIVGQEDAFIELAFEQGDIQGLTKEEMKTYIRFIADRRLIQLGLKANFGVKENPLPWMDEMISAPEFANFFEQRVTEYAKATTVGNWEDAIDEEDFIIMGKDGCKYCELSKELAEKYMLNYGYVDITHNKEARDLLLNDYNITTLPAIFKAKTRGDKNEIILGGYKEFKEYITG